MKIVESILISNPCFKAGKKINVKGLMLHSVGCPQPSAKVFVNNWNKDTYDKACVHAFIDATTGHIYETLPWNYRGWHCGDSGNNTHIGVEMCEPSCIKYTGGSSFTCSDFDKAREMVTATYNSAVELFAFLCEMYDLDPMAPGVIVSHKEGHSLGIASNHGDPEHLWRGLDLPYTMDSFRRAVNGKMGNVSHTTVTPTTVSLPYKVRVSIKNLNIRKGPGTNYSRAMYIPVGIYTIVEESQGKGARLWGKLKSGAGWISLDYATKL